MTTYTIEDFGYCLTCDFIASYWQECVRCGHDVCVTCHPTIGCDG